MIIYLICKVTFLAVFMACITQMKYSRLKSSIIIVCFNVAIVVINYLVYLVKGVDTLTSVFPITASAPAYLCFCIVSKSSRFMVLFSLLTVSIFGILTSYIGTMASLASNNAGLRLVAEILCFAVILFFIIKVFRKPYLKMLDTLENGWGLLCMVPSLLIFMLYLLQYYPTPIQDRPDNIPVLFVVFALTFVLYTIIYMNFRNISEFFQLRQDRKVLTLQMEMHKKEYNTLLDNVNSIRIFRHDMRHHINAIGTFLNDGNIAEAQKYIRRLDGTLGNATVEKYCENYCVNVILSSLFSRAEAEQIEVACDVQIPEDITVDNIELGLVFANAVENAIQACKSLEPAASRKISVVCKEHCGQIYIRVSNPYRGEVNFDGEFPVSSQAEHGIGTRSIAAVAEKHGGVFSFSAQDGVFKTTVTMKY